MGTATTYTKAGIDARAAAPSDTTPRPAGTAAPGTAATFARGDHVHAAVPRYPLTNTGSHSFAQPIGWVSAAGLTAAATKAPMTPLPVWRRMTLREVHVRINNPADAGTFALAIYACDDAGIPVGEPLWTSADTSATTSGPKAITGLSLTLEPGMYGIVAGSKGFTTRARFPTAQDDGHAMSMLPNRCATQADAFNAGTSLANFDEATGAFPTLAGTPADYTIGSALTAFWYAIKAEKA